MYFTLTHHTRKITNKEIIYILDIPNLQLQRVKRTGGANGGSSATKTLSPTPQNYKGRLTMPHISEPKRWQAKLHIYKARKGD